MYKNTAHDYSMVHWTVMDALQSKVLLGLGSVHIINFLYSRKFCIANPCFLQLKWTGVGFSGSSPCRGSRAALLHTWAAPAGLEPRPGRVNMSDTDGCAANCCTFVFYKASLSLWSGPENWIPINCLKCQGFIKINTRHCEGSTWSCKCIELCCGQCLSLT